MSFNRRWQRLRKVQPSELPRRWRTLKCNSSGVSLWVCSHFSPFSFYYWLFVDCVRVDSNEIIGISERHRDSRTVAVSECSTSTHTDCFGALLPVSPINFISVTSNTVKVPCCGCRDMCAYVHAFDMCDNVQHAAKNCAAVSWFCLLQCLLKSWSAHDHTWRRKRQD